MLNHMNEREIRNLIKDKLSMQGCLYSNVPIDKALIEWQYGHKSNTKWGTVTVIDRHPSVKAALRLVK